ncbi:MAG: GNAT family N-acetyltransferase [Pelagimonas sp.]|jgi:RimJ/RimL family protein N-acetyltransferase|nr:GNAT family N-acetyltransferase [Pelagimonas sp.]
MIRKAEAKDAPAIAAFLEAHIETSMFLLGNLVAHGTDNRDHPHGTSYFLRETGEGINGVFGCTNGGFLMCQLPGLTPTEAQTYAHLLKGYTFQGMTGQSEQVKTILDALPIDPNMWSCNRAEPLYTLDVSLILDQKVDLRPSTEAEIPMLVTWFEQYFQETAGPQDNGLERALRAVQTGQHRILWEGDTPVAMTGLNARYKGTVQIGSVFVPTELRGQGRAGQAILAHLHELHHSDGVAQAILFAASDKAAKAYERIGFAYRGEYQVAVLARPQMLDTPA